MRNRQFPVPRTRLILALTVPTMAALVTCSLQAGPGIFDAAVDIGNPLAPGATTLSGSTYTLKGSGADIWDTGDDFHFAYKSVTGNFEATMRLRSRSTSSPGAGQWGRNGLMARWSTATNAKYSLIATLLPTVDSGGLPAYRPFYQYRLRDLQNDGNRVNYWAEDGTFPLEGRSPTWVRLVRIGQAIHGYLAEDAGGRPNSWVLVGSDSAFDMPPTLLVGVYLQSQTGGTLGTITFDNLTIETPAAPPAPTCEAGEAFTGTDFNGGFGVLGSHTHVVRRSGDIIPGVVNGRLRLTQSGHINSTVAAWFDVPGTEALTQDGFRAEFDAFMTAPGLPGNTLVGDGMTFAVVQSGAEILPGSSVRCDAGFAKSSVNRPCTFELTNPTPSSPCDWELSVSGGQIGHLAGRDDAFGWVATDRTGDFDIAVEITQRSLLGSNAGGEPLLGPFGLMARVSMEPKSQFTMIQSFSNSGESWLGFRQDDGFTGVDKMPAWGNFARYLRLTRRGNVLQGWVAATRPRNPCSDTDWHPSPSINWGPNAPLTLKVGFANCVNTCSATQRVSFRLLPCDGTAPSDLAGAEYGSVLGYGGGSLRERTEGHPSFAVEMDSWIGGGEPGNDPPDGGAPDYPGTYHLGLDVNAEASSIQTSADRGLLSASLPDIFDPRGIHVTVDYAPSGQIDVFANRNSPPFVRQHVLSARIPPLSGPVLLGFTAGTGGASATQEIDNFVVTRLRGCGTAGGAQKPGDCNQDGQLDISDPVCLLGHLFLGKPEKLPCEGGTVNDAGNLALVDVNGDGHVDLSDAVYGLTFLFSGGAPPRLGRDCSSLSGCPAACTN